MSARFENGQMVFDVDPERYKRMLLAGIRSDPYVQQPKTTAEEDALVASAIAMQEQAAQAQALANRIVDAQNAPYDLSNPAGLIAAGNIDPYMRKVEYRPDGSIATVESFSTNLDGNEVLLPRVIDGRTVSHQGAINHYLQTGEHLGIFDTPEHANDYAQKFHENQAYIYRDALNNAADVNSLNQLMPGDPYEVTDASYIPLDQLMQYGTTNDPYEYDRSLYFPVDAETIPNDAYVGPVTLADAMVGRSL